MKENRDSLLEAFGEVVSQMEVVLASETLDAIDRDILLNKIRDFYSVVKNHANAPTKNAAAATATTHPQTPTSASSSTATPISHAATTATPQPLNHNTENATRESLKTETTEKPQSMLSVAAENMPTKANICIENICPSRETVKAETIPQKAVATDTLFDLEPDEEVAVSPSSESPMPDVLQYLHHNLQQKRDQQVAERLNQSAVETGGDKISTTEPLSKTIAESFSSSPFLGESLQPKYPDSKTELLSRIHSPSQDLRTAIGVNEKFMFINELFSGNMRSYTDFISRLNDCNDHHSAFVAVGEVSQDRQWAETSLAYSTLTSILNKKFAK